MCVQNPAIAEAVARLDHTRDALAAARIPYNAALDERDAALRDLERLRAPKPRTDFPLCG